MKNELFLVLSIFSVSLGQVKISGEQDGVFDSATYIVSKDIIIPAEKSLKFLPGLTGRFKMYRVTCTSKCTTPVFEKYTIPCSICS
jgi:hypothetical protein